MSNDAIEVEGVVVDVHAGDFYSVDCELGSAQHRVLAKRAGRLNVMRIRVVVGDRVRVEVSPYDTTRGRITYRIK